MKKWSLDDYYDDIDDDIDDDNDLDIVNDD